MQLLDALKGALKRFASTPTSDANSVTAAAQAEQEIVAALAAARASLDAIEQRQADTLIRAIAEDKPEEAARVQAEIAKHRQGIHELEVALAAVRQRLIAAKAAAGDRERAYHLAEARRIADVKRAALVRVQAAMTELATALNAANDTMGPLIEHLRAAGRDSSGAVFMPGVAPRSAGALVAMHLAADTDRVVPCASAMTAWELKQQPSLVARHDDMVRCFIDERLPTPEGDTPRAA